MKKNILFISLFATAQVFAQNDTIAKTTTDSIGTHINDWEENEFDESLEEIVIEFKRKIQLKQKGGKYEVNLENTNFNKFTDTWEGLKNIPMLQTTDGQELKIKGKTAIVEIDGVRTELSGEELESYLRSLNPDTVSKIELISNPGAAYDSSVDAVVNIVLKQKEKSYRFSISENVGTRNKPFSHTNVNYSENFNKLYLYTNYNFNYTDISTNADTEIQSAAHGIQKYTQLNNSISRSHNFQLNLTYKVNDKNNIYLSGFYTKGINDGSGRMIADFTQRSTNRKGKNDFLRLSQIWKSNLSDKLELKAGSYQIFNNSNSTLNVFENSENQQQKLENNTPIIIGFADLSLTSALGKTDFGSRFHTIAQKNNNNTFLENNHLSTPFYYNEKVLALYLDHSYDISEHKSFTVGVRTESTFSDYTFENNILNQKLHDKQTYTNLLFNLGYFWNNEKTHQSLALRKQISRPNYGNINPFRSFNNDITQNTGDQDIKPMLSYSLSYELMVNKFLFSMSGAYIDNFISNFMEEDNGTILSTYKNFDDLYVGSLGVEYNNHILNGKWNIRPTLDLSLAKIIDKTYNIKKNTPIISFGVNNNIDLGKDYLLMLNYHYTASYKDGLLQHRHSHALNSSLSKKIKNFNIIVYANDILKSNIQGIKTLLDNYYYGTEVYSDTRNFGISLRYTFTGKRFKAEEIEKIQDSTIDRL